MNRECKRHIRDIESRNTHIAAKLWLTLYKLDLIPVPKMHNWQMPRDEEHRKTIIRSMIDGDCRNIGRELMQKYGSERIKRIKQWRMVVS